MNMYNSLQYKVQQSRCLNSSYIGNLVDCLADIIIWHYLTDICLYLEELGMSFLGKYNIKSVYICFVMAV